MNKRCLPIDRRTLFRAAGGAALALPWLERTAGAAVAKRLIVFFTPNGTIRDNWLPTAGATAGADYQFSRILAPLEPHRKDLVLISGMNQMQGGGGDNHTKGMSCMLTGVPENTGGPWGGTGSWAGGISVDQVIADKIGADTRFKSIECGVGVGLGPPGGQAVTAWTRMCYRGSNQPLHPENSPYKVYGRVFAEVGSSPAEALRLRGQRRSVLDALRADYTALVNRLGAEDRQRVESHLSALREIETSLDAGADSRTCGKPDQGVAIDVLKNDNFPAVGKLHMDLIARTLACDLTRVASLQWSHSVGETRHTWAGVTGPHHELSHAPDSDAAAKEQLTKINTWYAQQLAYLIAKLKELPEAGGTVFDNTCIVWVNELSKGNSHSGQNQMYVIAGSAGGAIKTGRYLALNGSVPHNNLLLSLCHAMGVPATTFGKPEWCTGPLPGLA
jgi:hypothetical protein